MNTEKHFIILPARKNTAATEIYIQLICERKIGDRETILLLPGGPGGNHTVYNTLKEKLYEHADLVLMDPRGCGKSQSANVEDCIIEKT